MFLLEANLLRSYCRCRCCCCCLLYFFFLLLLLCYITLAEKCISNETFWSCDEETIVCIIQQCTLEMCWNDRLGCYNQSIVRLITSYVVDIYTIKLWFIPSEFQSMFFFYLHRSIQSGSDNESNHQILKQIRYNLFDLLETGIFIPKFMIRMALDLRQPINCDE